MNDTLSSEPISCICLPSDYSIALSVIGIVLPLLISEVLPFIPCEENGILHTIFLKMKCKKINVTPVKN